MICDLFKSISPSVTEASNGGGNGNQPERYMVKGGCVFLFVRPFPFPLNKCRMFVPNPPQNVSQLARGFRRFRSTKSTLGLYHHTVSIYQCH